MVVKVKRAFKKADRLYLKFSSTSIQVGRGASIPSFRINAPFLCCAFFFKEHLSPQVKINKMINSVNYHVSLSALTSRIHLVIFYRLFRALCLSRMFFEFFLKPVYPAKVWENFQFYGV